MKKSFKLKIPLGKKKNLSKRDWNEGSSQNDCLNGQWRPVKNIYIYLY